MFVYADNAATTSVSKTALDAMLPYLTEQYGNPSSLYSFGQKAQEALDSRVRGMDAYWKGEGSVHVRSEYEKCKKEVHSIINRLNEYPADLLQAVQVLGRVQPVALGVPLGFDVFRERVGPEPHQRCALTQKLGHFADSVI